MNTIAKLGDPLTPAERDVAALIAKDFTDKEIAKLLSLSWHTVVAHRARIRKKVGGRTAAITTYCIREKIVLL